MSEHGAWTSPQPGFGSGREGAARMPSSLAAGRPASHSGYRSVAGEGHRAAGAEAAGGRPAAGEVVKRSALPGELPRLPSSAVSAGARSSPSSEEWEDE